MPSRRHFLAASAATVTAAALPKSLLASSTRHEVFTNASLGAYTQGILTQANFESVVGSTFTLFLDNDAVTYLRLVKVIGASTSGLTATQGLSRAPLTAARVPRVAPTQTTSFRLSFSTSGAVFFPQSTYLLDHGTLGEFAAFLVPGDPILASGTCSAVFNYLTAATLNAPVFPARPTIGKISTPFN